MYNDLFQELFIGQKEKPKLNAKVLTKLNFGQPVTVEYAEEIGQHDILLHTPVGQDNILVTGIGGIKRIYLMREIEDDRKCDLHYYDAEYVDKNATFYGNETLLPLVNRRSFG